MATTSSYDVDLALSKANTEFNKLFDLAFGAIGDLRSSTKQSIQSTYGSKSDLEFDPGTPDTIQVYNAIAIKDLLTKIDDYIRRIDQINIPNLPDFNFKGMLNYEVWEDDLNDQLKASIKAYITSMGIPDKTYQDAIFNEDYNRQLQVLNDALELVDAKVGARGFTYSNDYGNGLKSELLQKYQFDRVQISRDITKTVTEWARQNYQFAMDKGLSYEQMQMDFTYKYCTAYVDVYKASVTALLDRYKAQIEALTIPINAMILEINANLDYTKVRAEIDKTNETLKQSRSQIEISEALQKYSTDTTRLNNEFSGQLEQIRASAQAAANLMQANSTSVFGIKKY